MPDPHGWAAHVGKPYEGVVAAIRAAHPSLHVQAVSSGGMMTMDYRTDRVRVIYDGNGLVAAVPMIG